MLKDGGDPRTVEQLRADVLLDLVLGQPIPGPPDPAGPAGQADPAPPVGRAGRGGLELTVPLLTLLKLAEHPGELGSWGPVLADTARQIVADLATAPWRLSTTDGSGRVIWNGPMRRRPTTADAGYVKARDRRCRFPGCRRPAHRAEMDHTAEWQHGGPTIPPNLGMLCKRHHTLKSKGLWQVMQVHDGWFVWRSKLGRTYVVRPEPVDEPDDEPDF